MDDGRYVSLAGKTDPIAFAIHLFDPGNGFIRWFSWLIIWPSSRLGYEFGAEVYFTSNLLIVVMCLGAFWLAYSRFCHWSDRWLFPLFMGIALAWPYTAELFFFPSLQEKAVLFGVTVLLGWVVLRDRVQTPWQQIALLLVATGIAFTTKTQIVLFVPGLVLALWVFEPSTLRPFDRQIRILATIVWTIGSVVLVIFASTSAYASSTQGEIGLAFLQDRRFQLILSLLLLYAVAVGWRIFRKTFVPTDLVPLVLLISICATFLVWDMRNYYLSVASVIVAAMVSTCVSWWKRREVTAVVGILSVLLATGWLVIRLPQVYESLASVRQFLESDYAQDLSAKRVQILVSCIEAPLHYNKYADDFNVSGLEFAVATGDPYASPDSSTYVFADSRLCPWPSVVSRDAWEPSWISLHGQDAYVLYSR